MFGTVVNTIAIIIGGFIGTVFNKNLPIRYQTIIFQGIGLFIVTLGVSMAIKMECVLISVFSLLLGGFVGEFFKLDKQINALGEWLKRSLRFKNEKFTEGFVSASLIYCIGAMAILGAIEEGTGNYPAILLTKSVMDGFSSLAFAAALGVGVIFSAASVAIYQGGITLIVFLFADNIDAAIVNELSAVGGILLIGLGVNILEIKDVKVVNLLPALVFVVLLMLIFVNK